jgi:hypothetical protein
VGSGLGKRLVSRANGVQMRSGSPPGTLRRPLRHGGRMAELPRRGVMGPPESRRSSAPPPLPRRIRRVLS